MKQNNILQVAIVSLIFGIGCKAHDNDDKNYTDTKSEARKRINNCIKPKFCDPGFLWNFYNDSYDDNQSEKDAKLIYELVENKVIKNAQNFKRVLVKKWHRSRTLANAENALKEALRKLIIKRISEINPDFSCKAQEIAFNILKLLRDGNEKKFIGTSLETKIKTEMHRIRREQEKIERDAKTNNQSRVAIKKFYPNPICCICRNRFGNLGMRRYMAPCGHDICPNCFNNLENSSNGKIKCPHCREQIKGYMDTPVQKDHNPEYDRE